MSLSPQISFRNVVETEPILLAIQKQAMRLERFFPRITSCHVIVESPHHHRQRGQHYHVRVDLSVPGRDIVVSRNPEKKEAHQDLYVAIRDAFSAATRQLEDYARCRRGHMKRHLETAAHL
jgi:ribosomal subunit interface protein